MSVLVARCPDEAPAAVQRATAHRLLDLALRLTFDIAAPAVVERTAWGKPRVTGRRDVHFSVAHCRQAVAVLLAGREVGVDVEAVRARDPYLGARCFDPTELDRVEAAADPDREFVRYWTLKESYVKALGCGLAYPLRRVRFAVTDGRPSSTAPGAGFRLVEELPGIVIALCWLGAGGADPRTSVTVVDW